MSLILPLLLSAATPTAVQAHPAALVPSAPEAPLAELLESLDPEVRAYDEHLSFLANPFLGGRLPGTPGMEIAKDYVEHHFRSAGLEPAFTTAEGEPSYRQPFELNPTAELQSQELAAGSHAFEAGVDFTALSLGAAGNFDAPVTFVGYSIAGGEGGYSSYTDDDDLSGQVALMFRFEPMDAAGKSRWTESDSASAWSSNAGFVGKVRAAAKRGAAAIVIVNPPGAGDPRAEQLANFSTGPRVADVPVLMLQTEAGVALLEQLNSGQSLTELREVADLGRSIVHFEGQLSGSIEIEETTVSAENVGGLVPGRGALADELVVIGAHLDHLGMGNFGSRDRELAGKVVHPGADDNASGSAAMILLGERLMADYAELPPGASARSILILCFSAEESGLNGANAYVKDPIRPLDQHCLMLNFDMIGRLVDDKISVSGLGSGEGLERFAQSHFARSPMDVVASPQVPQASDHWAFYRKDVPVLFGICTPLHKDYHTSRDTTARINRRSAVDATRLWHSLALGAALRAEPFEFTRVATGSLAQTTGSDSQRRNDRGTGNVRLGIQPADYNDTLAGVAISGASPGTPADRAGLRDGDRLVGWDGEEIGNIQALMGFLSSASPGDKVGLRIVRGSETIEVEVELAAKDAGSR